MTFTETVEAAGLTGRQLGILRFIHSRIVGQGYPPTVREIGDEFGISSPNGVLCHLAALAKKGFVERVGATARGIRLRGMKVETRYTGDEAGRLLALAVGGEGGAG